MAFGRAVKYTVNTRANRKEKEGDANINRTTTDSNYLGRNVIKYRRLRPV